MGDQINNNRGEKKPKYSHFTHHHPLELTNISSQATSHTCSGCKRHISAGKDFYTCTSKACSYYLHRACYNMPSLIQHPGEPAGHDLNLLLLPSFDCKACGLKGSGFCYNCRTCVNNYHSLCLRMSLTESCAAHQHVLNLVFSPPYGSRKGFCCDVCGQPGSNHWLYRCNECDYDVHLNCIYAAPIPQFQSQNFISIMSSSTGARAPPCTPSAPYLNISPFSPHGNYANQTESYMLNPGISSQPGVVGMAVIPSHISNTNQAGLSGGQGVLGAGVTRLIATAVLDGIGEGIGQEIVQGLFDGFGNSGPSTCDQTTWN